MEPLSLVAVLLIGASIALVVRAVLLPRLQSAERVRDIAAYGFNAPVTAAAGAQDRPVFAGLATRVGEGLAGRMRNFSPESQRRDLVAAGIYGTTPQQLLGYRVLLAGVGLTLGVLTMADGGFVKLMLGTVGFAGIGWLVPVFYVGRRARHRLDLIDRELPDLIDLLVVTVEAGLGLAASLQLSAGKFDGPLADELRLTLQEQRMGRSLSDALTGMLGRVDTPGVRSFVRSVVQGETLGVGIGTIMRNLATEMRKRRRSSAEEQAQKAPVKMLFPLVFLILPSLLVVILGPALFSIAESLGG
jgi:tight adherence protein C